MNTRENVRANFRTSVSKDETANKQKTTKKSGKKEN